MDILMVTSEIVPFSKTGGLADVSGALPKALANEGENVTVITPFYRMAKNYIRDKGIKLDIIDKFSIHISNNTDYHVVIKKTSIPNTDVDVLFIECDSLYDREGLYQENGKDYDDNDVRFIVFSRSVIEIIKKGIVKCDVLHAHDWQSALTILYGKHEHLEFKTVFTIHNLAYQGLFDAGRFYLLGLPGEYFRMESLEFWGKVNFLKAGIVYSDWITTVSKRYSEEIQTEEYGCGLEGVLRYRSSNLSGVLNGIDVDVWNPQTDELIYNKYGIGEWAGKEENKKRLMEDHGLEYKKGRPLIGIISRLADQKGFDILIPIIDDIMNQDVAMILLGTGKPEYEEAFRKLGEKYKDRLSTNITFNNELAHKIEAGSDMFLMPSYYEPCGLNQMYSMRYGTVPVVRFTGGLADTVIDESKGEDATGFVFEEYKTESLLNAVLRAIDIYQKNIDRWHTLQYNGMKKDFSWNRSAREYIEIYRRITGV